MKLYFYGFIMLIKKFIFKYDNGEAILWFASKMGVVYIKFAQILSMYNFDNVFSEKDRVSLSKICDNIKTIKFSKIKKILEKEYNCALENKFKKVYEEPVGSASISQVHKAILKNGEIVAIKIKRKDITKKMNNDFKQLKNFIYRFGWIIKFNNFSAANNALNLLKDWIKTETDFNNEKNNIIEYQKFAKSVNNKVDNCKNIVVPKLYKKLCTDNIIVMEFINSKTINQIKLNNKNKERIRIDLNDYISLSFYALFNYRNVTFHGDPHGGNIYLDKNGNIGFLDMGLTFNFKDEEADYVKNLLLYSYFKKSKELTELLLSSSKYVNVDEEALHEEIKKCCNEFKNIPVTNYFVNMVMIFTKYDINPPEVLYKLTKAFISLNGINNVVDNILESEKILTNQITEYYVSRTVSDFKDIISESVHILPDFIKESYENGITKGISKQVNNLFLLNKKISKTTKNFNEILSLINSG